MHLVLCDHSNAVRKNLTCTSLTGRDPFVGRSKTDIVRTIVPAADTMPGESQSHQATDRSGSGACSEEDLTAGHGVALKPNGNPTPADASHTRDSASKSSSPRRTSKKDSSKKEGGSKKGCGCE